MNARQVLATVTVSDFAASSAWYSRLFGRDPDNTPNASCAEWQIARRTRIQLLSKNERVGPPVHCGATSVGIMVENLDEILHALQDRHIDVPAPQLATHYVRFAPVCDPDGNTVTFVESAMS